MAENNISSIIPFDVLVSTNADHKDGNNKPTAIVRGTSAWISLIASSLLILTIVRSSKRLTTTYHRLLLGMSIGDILFSLSLATYQVMSPSDVDYLVWNARGNQATCDAQGFVTVTGIILTLSYSCTLNLYYLAIVRYNESEAYVRTKMERFLHGIPISMAFLFSIVLLVFRNYNDVGSGYCADNPIYNPKHCEGYDDGEVREGFEIPCGRGRYEIFFYVFSLLFFLLPPIIIGVSLGMIYRTVRKQDQRMAKFGVGALNLSAPQTGTNAVADHDENDDDGCGSKGVFGGGSLRGSINSFLSSARGRLSRMSASISSPGEISNSRAVMHRALAFSIAYIVSWVWPIGFMIMFFNGDRLGPWYGYLWAAFHPLQGFFNFLVYLYPKVASAKRSPAENLSWCQAFGKVFWAGIIGPKKKKGPPINNSRDKRKNTPPVPRVDMRNTSATDISNTISIQRSSGHPKSSINIEEEKTEIQAPVETA